MATLCFLPRAIELVKKPLEARTVEHGVVSQHVERVIRTSWRPPRMCRWPRKAPESQFNGATPASLAMTMIVR